MAKVVQEELGIDAGEEQEVRRSFRAWRTLLPIAFGLLAVGFLLWHELREEGFEKVAEGTGNYAWADTNGNGEVDLADAAEFVPAERGDYKLMSGTDRLRSVRLAPWGVLLLFAALIANALRDYGYIVRLRILTDGEFGWKRSFQVVALWEFATAVAPAVVGGTSVAIYVMAKDGTPLGRSAAIVLVTAMLDELFFLVFAPAVFFLVGIDKLFPPELDEAMWGLPVQALFWIGYVFIAVMKLTVFYSVFFRPRAIKLLLVSLFKHRWIRRLRPRMAEAGDDLIAASDQYKGRSLAFWLKAIAATWCSWGARFLVLNFIAAAFFPVSDHLLMYARQIVLWVILLISPTPGASGAAEFAFVGFMRDLMPAGAMLVVVALLWRLFTYYFYLFLGAIVAPGWLRRTGKARQH
ncbi:MAG: flippase-like domain-containing protein [Flavobacteriales bacterium]|nr:flippase-like domain-containing protein [Flavobacteriales bacterium]MCB0757413.1 flippase-like domain-containing protein [Flavobacteriales bacterium]